MKSVEKKLVICDSKAVESYADYSELSVMTDSVFIMGYKVPFVSLDILRMIFRPFVY